MICVECCCVLVLGFLGLVVYGGYSFVLFTSLDSWWVVHSVCLLCWVCLCCWVWDLAVCVGFGFSFRCVLVCFTVVLGVCGC